MPKGVMEQYKVVDRQTGEEVKGLFVIDPIRDPHARAGLMAYARSVGDDNFQLSMDLMHYVTRLDETERRNKQRISGSTQLPDWLIELAQDNDTDEGSDSDS